MQSKIWETAKYSHSNHYYCATFGYTGPCCLSSYLSVCTKIIDGEINLRCLSFYQYFRRFSPSLSLSLLPYLYFSYLRLSLYGELWFNLPVSHFSSPPPHTKWPFRKLLQLSKTHLTNVSAIHSVNC